MECNAVISKEKMKEEKKETRAHFSSTAIASAKGDFSAGSS